VSLRRPGVFSLVSIGFVTLAALWLSWRSNTEWDYWKDGGPPIDALAHLRIHEFLAARPVMGPFSLVLRAPFAAVGQLIGNGGAHYSYLDDYRYGVFPIVLVAGGLGFALARIMEREGRGALARAAVVVLAVINPVALRAIHFGHPEEILGAALLVGSALAALRGRPWLGAVLLGLAVMNKQWAVIGVPTVALILILRVGWQRVRGPALILLGIGLVLTVPLLIVDAHSLVHLTRQMADLRGTYVWPASIWYPFAPDLSAARAAVSQPGLHQMPDWLGLVGRPLVLSSGLIVPLLLSRRVKADLASRALPLLALVMLLRCMLDPANNGYYHEPFFLALLAADALAGRFYATAAACVVLQLPTTFQFTAQQLNGFYIAWAVPFAIYLAGRAYGLDWMALLRSRAARGPAAARTPHPS
jgi:glycosyl transferase family 87